MTYSTLNPKPGLERQVAVGRDMSQLRRRSFFSRKLRTRFRTGVSRGPIKGGLGAFGA